MVKQCGVQSVGLSLRELLLTLSSWGVSKCDHSGYAGVICSKTINNKRNNCLLPLSTSSLAEEFTF